MCFFHTESVAKRASNNVIFAGSLQVCFSNEPRSTFFVCFGFYMKHVEPTTVAVWLKLFLKS